MTSLKQQKAQIDKFKEAAKELECDESEEAFDANLKRIAKSPPPKGEKNDGKNTSSD
ncbi:hypothetical protein [Roseibium sp. Sym1]|uniref:hypothetical protein n=1 Tax=Roseibium sp. Sym1 TaxID=3016006 RepID=UPI0022B3946E|nr:hypothetical protein [Roseibium sp. Sym1]